MQNFHFYKTSAGWFIDLPEYVAQGGSIGDLQMVEGADIMLDLVAGGEQKINLGIASEPFEGSEQLILIETCDPSIGGGYYFMQQYNGVDINQRIWLCAVTTFVFGNLPAAIFIKRGK